MAHELEPCRFLFPWEDELLTGKGRRKDVKGRPHGWSCCLCLWIICKLLLLICKTSLCIRPSQKPGISLG
jgi:hypothetical protein